MAITRAQKETMVETARETFEKAAVVVLAHNQGLTVAQVSELRRRMRDAGANYRVVKNRLAKIAMAGTPFESATSLLKGPTTFGTSPDPVTAAKVMVEFAKTNDKLVIIGGAFNGQALDAKGVQTLATMPSLDELRGKIVGLLQAPAQKIMGVLQAPGGQVARVIGAYSKKEA